MHSSGGPHDFFGIEVATAHTMQHPGSAVRVRSSARANELKQVPPGAQESFWPAEPLMYLCFLLDESKPKLLPLNHCPLHTEVLTME